MSTNITEMLVVLSQAKEAQDAVPAMKAELDRLRRALEASQSEANRYKQASQDIGVELSSAKSLADNLKGERDDAMFHALELEEKLSSITKVMGSALGLVEPPKAGTVKAEAEPVKVEEAPVSVPQGQPAQSTGWSQDEYKRQDEEHRAYHWNDQAPEVAAPSPSPTPWKDQTDKAMQDGQAPAQPAAAPETDYTPTSSSVAESPTPTASSYKPMTEADSRPAYLGVRWQDKPSYISWSDFVDQGGEKPYWM